MIGEYTVVEWMQYLLKRWMKILIVVATLSLLMGMPKTFKSNSILPSTDFHISEVVTFENHDTYIGVEGAKHYFNYGDIWFKNPILAKFSDKISVKYKMEKFEKNWNEYGGMGKLDWIREHFKCDAITSTPSYVIDFSIDTASENYEYIKENSQELFKDFVTYMEESTETYHPKSQIRQMDFGFQESFTESQSTHVIKYYVLGGILGGVFIVFIYSILFLGGKKVSSKKLLESRFHVDSIDATERGLAYEILCYSIEQSKRCGKRLIVLSSTLEDKSFFEEVLTEFSKYGYSVLCADFSNSIEYTTKKGIKALDKNIVEKMKIPGRFGEQLSTIGTEYEYFIFYSNLVFNDSAALELFENSACGVFVEKIGVSHKYPLEKTLSVIRKYASNQQLCLAWKK